MFLRDLLPSYLLDQLSNHPVITQNPFLTRLSVQAQNVRPGDMYFALPSESGKDTLPYIRQAIRNKACVVIVPPRVIPVDTSPTIIVVDDARAILSYAAAKFYAAKPDHIVAVTGTNGKSSVVNFVNQLWGHTGILGASVGTLGVHINTEKTYRDVGNTTPDIIFTHELLQELKNIGAEHVALEASSHGLSQKRLDNINVRAAAFTNLSQDHLDYHKTFDAYFAAKSLLFTKVLTHQGTAVINMNDPYGQRLVDLCIQQKIAAIITIGNTDHPFVCDFTVLDITPKQDRQDITVQCFGVTYHLTLPLIGEFQIYNALTACALAYSAGMALEDTLSGLEQLQQIPGRLEYTGQTPTGGRVYVDYAHTPDALSHAIAALKKGCGGKLHLVFGCGGNRDSSKRSLMGHIAESMADVVIITDDNPRFESPEAIRTEIQAAAPHAQTIGDRYLAIKTAIQNLQKDDILLITGKGHETYQIYNELTFDFDDRSVVREILGDL
ncbi:MAG: UDP-N-acetylmuramoyl-L-alanyl-D-glutamate--2,6-diaminopimelate ligase [Alphaproteobacteria bacterium]|nr:MAG: UDP-N-acetylmuramoyl-L-alanyl-D-glutamate--2,6-diaminopimelate ligase [Alphaproteobacteria bacterium]